MNIQGSHTEKHHSDPSEHKQLSHGVPRNSDEELHCYVDQRFLDVWSPEGYTQAWRSVGRNIYISWDFIFCFDTEHFCDEVHAMALDAEFLSACFGWRLIHQ